MRFSWLLQLICIVCLSHTAFTTDDVGLNDGEKQLLSELGFSAKTTEGIQLARAFLLAHPRSKMARTQIFAWSLQTLSFVESEPRSLLMSFASEILGLGIEPNAKQSEYGLTTDPRITDTSLFERALRVEFSWGLYSPLPFLINPTKYEGFIPFVRKLFEQEADPNTMMTLHLEGEKKGREMKIPALFGTLNNPELLSLFLEFKADINKTDTRGWSAISHVFFKNKVFYDGNRFPPDENDFFRMIKVLDILDQQGLKITEKDMCFVIPNLELLRRLGHKSLVQQIETYISRTNE